MKRWDLFCKVIDNFGDIGISWRLARQLTREHDINVRLWVDDLSAFARLCSAVDRDRDQQWIDRIDVRKWSHNFRETDIAEVVVEAFACDIPESYVAGMANVDRPPVWINLEYLSAEAWVNECHQGKSRHPRWPLTKYFFFPGFTAKTGGLLKEADLDLRHAAFTPDRQNCFWNELGIAPPDRDQVQISLFCYDNPNLSTWLDQLAAGNPARLLVTPGLPTAQVESWLGRSLLSGAHHQVANLIVQPIPFLSQTRYDELLWACDINFVRGEDSFIRAQWARRPFVWQIYPQSQDSHLTKLDAFLEQYLNLFGHPEAVKKFWRAWNGAGEIEKSWSQFLTHRLAIEKFGIVWADQLDRAGNLADNLVRFVRRQ